MRRNSRRDREICLEAHLKRDEMGEYLICHCCGMRINPKTTAWRADHIRRHAHGGESTGENLWPILLTCDVGPDGKVADDTRAVAKGKRMRANAYGLRDRGGWWKPDGYKHQWGRR